ncbi:MOSC domain-containing protein [Leekyejoonella antrihumi]|uniref:MOSC domain-containing protein n=1 Tax=Leekyejoonella antrihumi TaxID=1660198 RepID=A0A563E0D9_9MICO|nr:MOSC domain-containing protein [Leekyejoonella antrihumi]TWP35671.1 MOSC domain-containing protein [Leekyejoonella antrihumi]
MSPRVVAVHVNPVHTFSKQSVPSVTLREGLGVVGDAHYGVTVQHRSRVAKDPSEPNLRQVHLIHAELFDDLAKAGHQVAAGDLGENITTRGIDLLGLPVGARLTMGDAVVTVTGLRNPCRQIDEFQDGLLRRVVYTDPSGRVVRLTGVMGIVCRDGTVSSDQPIEVALPPGEHHPLTRV